MIYSLNVTSIKDYIKGCNSFLILPSWVSSINIHNYSFTHAVMSSWHRMSLLPLFLLSPIAGLSNPGTRMSVLLGKPILSSCWKTALFATFTVYTGYYFYLNQIQNHRMSLFSKFSPVRKCIMRKKYSRSAILFPHESTQVLHVPDTTSGNLSLILFTYSFNSNSCV